MWPIFLWIFYISIGEKRDEVHGELKKESSVSGSLQKQGVSRANKYLVMFVSENHQDVNYLGILSAGE